MVKYTSLAKEVPVCMGCRKAADGTIVLAHRNLNGWGLKAGRGIKTISLCGAFLCYTCHVFGDGDGQEDHHWWELAIHRSLTWAYDNGHLAMGTGEIDDKLR